MSGNHSACIPPPSNYSSRARPQQAGRPRGQRGGRGHPRKQGQFSDRGVHQDKEEKLKNQPVDRFYRNSDDDYFAHVEDDGEGLTESDKVVEEAEEDDPLDAYMKSIEGQPVVSDETDSKEVDVVESHEHPIPTQDLEKKGVRLDIDDNEDIEESYYQYVEQTKNKKSSEDVDDSDDKTNLVEYDRDGNVVSVRKVKKDIDPLPQIDHSEIDYEDFEKVFYQEHEEIKKLSLERAEDLRSKLEIKVSGENPPKPVCSFAHFKFDERLMRVIRKSEYTQPTPIQAQAIPAALSGRNIIGIAMTGSGKTAAYLWPMIVHIMGQPDLKKGDGPIGLVLVPTRELALQVYGEARKFANSYNISVICAYGGGSKYEQSKDLEAGAEIVVATPGRLIDLIRMNSTNLRRVTYLVLDEADRFFEMGFEAQVRSICDHIRPDRQTLLFSATFRNKIEQLARTVTKDPIKILQKNLGEANEDVNQHVRILDHVEKKWEWLNQRLVEFMSSGSVLIFVTRITNSEELHNNLKKNGTDALLLHGDMEQSERNRVITSFKRKEKDILVATDVAARGLDIAHIRTVINYDVARDIDTHIHRVGRTGRAGTKGDAYTLLTEKDKDFAGHLVKNFKSSNQAVCDDLMKLAMESRNFRRTLNQRQNQSGSRNHQHHHSSHRYHHKGEGSSAEPHHHHHHRSHHHSDQNSYHHRHDGSDRRHSHHSREASYEGRDDRGRSGYDRQDPRKRARWH